MGNLSRGRGFLFVLHCPLLRKIERARFSHNMAQIVFSYRRAMGADACAGRYWYTRERSPFGIESLRGFTLQLTERI